MKRAIVCVLPVGVAGGALLSLAGLVTPVIGISLGCVYGLIFAWSLADVLVLLGEASYGVSHSRWCCGWWAQPPSDHYLCPRYRSRRRC
jgi:hypothetical protein